MAVLRECKIWKWNFRGIDKPQPLGPPVSIPFPRCTVHYTFKILSLHTCARRVTACRTEGKKKERKRGEKKSYRAATTCLLRDAVVSALVICPFVTDVPSEGAIIFAYMHTKIFALSTTPTLAGGLYIVSYDSKYEQEILSIFEFIYISRLKNNQ